jgi:hypothetical protein
MPIPNHSNTLLRKIMKAATNPLLVYNALKMKVIRIFAAKEYIGTDANRSESDDCLYISLVQSAVHNYKVFSTFKRHPSYRAILEHVSEADGRKYLDIVKNESPDFIDNVDIFRENDLIGAPITYRYSDVGTISPTTLRYMKVASDLRNLFDGDIGEKVAEIGVGYGGQLLINDRVFKIKTYDLFDLPPVLSLVSKVLESHILNCSYRTSTLNQSSGDNDYDLVISNYAFSELPSQLQLKYIEKIISRSIRGYLTMNSGLNDSLFKNNRLSVDDLRRHLPEFEIVAENPLTAPDNYIIVWGHKNSN